MKNSPKLLCFLLACGCTLISGCAKQSDYDALQRKMSQQDAELRRLQPAQADNYASMQTMQQEISSLRGQLEELQRAGGGQALSSLTNKVNRHETALRLVGQALAIELPLEGASSGRMMQDPDVQTGYPTGVQQQSNYSGGIAPAPSGATPSSSSTTTDMALSLYNSGVRDFNARQYPQAQRSFSDFIKNYKSHPKMHEAQYYLAECYFQSNQFSDAALAYETVISKYPKGSKTPAAYLKQGISFSKLGQAAAAKTRMQELIKNYPSSAEAARARTFLQTNK